MTTHDRVSAEIIQFPPRGRFAAGACEEANVTRISPRIAFAGAWYHEEAIREAEPRRKN
jgi:Protein of unknown function (DUF2735)